MYLPRKFLPLVWFIPQRPPFFTRKNGRIGTASNSLLPVSDRKRGSSVVRHLPLVLEVPGSIPARGEKNFGVRTHFL